MQNFTIKSINTRKTVLQTALIAAFALAAFAPISSIAQTKGDGSHWRGTQGQVWKSSTGLCWRSSTWTAADATEECEPELMKKAEAAPAPKVADATPPPQRAPEPAPTMETRKLTFLSEELFDFDKAVLKPQGKAALDDLAAQLNGVNNESIVVMGHTDRIGSKPYNQKLSERRAEVVRSYLISKGIQENVIASKGLGESDPVTKAGDCKGPKSQKLIACLQPDRRVEIEVTGSKQQQVAANTERSNATVESDSAITTKVKDQIFNEPTTHSRMISVETYQGNVQLTGFVASQAEMDKAGAAARNVQGVTSVKNDLQIK